MAQAVHSLLDGSVARAKAHSAHSKFSSPENFRLEFIIAEDEHLAGPHFTPRMNEPQPNIVTLRMSEQELNFTGQVLPRRGIMLSNFLRARSTPASQQPCRKDLGVVENRQVTGLEDLREV